MDASFHMKPPDWDEDQGPRLRAVCIFFVGVTTLFVLVRLASQLRVHRRLFWDDGWLVAGLLLLCGLEGVDLWGLNNGLGLHVDRVMTEDPRPPSSFIKLWKVGFVNSILIYLCLFTVKMSLLLLYKRLFWIARWFRIAWWINLVYALLWCISMTLTAIFQCSPINYAWNRMYLLTHIPAPFRVEGTCIDQYFVTAAASLSLASDVGIWLLPMITIFQLQMTTRRKIEMGLLLSLGLVALACGLVKTIISNKALISRDVSWANAPLATWASAEEAVGILCSCIPVIVGNIRAIPSMRSKKTQPVYYGDSNYGGKKNTYAYGSDKSALCSNCGTKSHFGQSAARPSTYRDEEIAFVVEMEPCGTAGKCAKCGATNVWKHEEDAGGSDHMRAMSNDLELQTPKKNSEWV